MISRAAAIGNAAARHAWARLRGRPHWAAVTLLVTFRCNLRCPYCDFPRLEMAELSFADITTLLRGLRRQGTLRLSISGGEPLLRRDIDEVLTTACHEGFIVSLVTNGTLIAERRPPLSAVDYLLCALEGDETAHDRARGAGTYKRVISGLEFARTHTKTRIGVICPVHSGNVQFLDEPLRLSEQFGITAFYQPVQVHEGWYGAPLRGELPASEIRAAFARLLQWKRSGRPVGNSRRYLELVAAGHHLQGRDCVAGKYFVTILPDGRVAPCCMFSSRSDWPLVDRAAPQRTAAVLTRPGCSGCTIPPYMENSHLLQFRPASWIELLQWQRRGPRMTDARPRAGTSSVEGALRGSGLSS